MITGGTGFIGRHLINALGENVIEVHRGQPSGSIHNNIVKVESITGKTDYKSEYFNEVDCVIHLAAIAHSSSDEMHSVNCEGAAKLAKAAAVNGVRRFIFISSIGVNGACNSEPFKSSDAVKPEPMYAMSKYNAEIELKKIAEQSAIEVVIIRPPLVYGKHATGNFAKLIKLANSNLPLPLGAIHNKRSFVAVDNLVSLIKTCISHPKAANKTFLVSDDDIVSTSEFLLKLIKANNKSTKLIPLPVGLLIFLSKIVGKQDQVTKFTNSLTVDIEYTKSTLNWVPPLSLDEGVRRCFK